MAKQLSLKQQIYQQIANKQVQEVLNKQRERETANLMADFDSFMQQKQNPEELMADFNSFMQQQNSQPVQQAVQAIAPEVKATPVIQEKIPSIADIRRDDNLKYRQDKRRLALENKQLELENKRKEDYQRQQQEENMLASQAAKKSKEEIAKDIVENKTVDKFAPQVDIQDHNNVNDYRKNLLGNSDPEQAKKAAQAQEERVASKEAEIQKQINAIPDSAIEDYAKKKGISVEMARIEVEDTIRKANSMNTSFAPTNSSVIDQGATENAQALSAEQKRLDAQKPFTPYESFLEATGKAVTDVVNGPVYLAGKLTGTNWDLYPERVRDEYAQSKEQHPTASNAGTMAGMALAAYAAGGGAGGRKFASEGLPKVTDTLAEKGLGAAAKQIARNAGKEVLKTDLATDILPTLANDIAEGKSTPEIVGNTILNTGMNWGFNAIDDILSLGKAMRNANVDLKTKNSLDELDNTRYYENAKNVEANNGGLNYGKDINGTGNPENIRMGESDPILPENSGQSEGTGAFGRRDSSISGRAVVNPQVRQIMSEAGVNDVKLRDYSNNYKAYSDALSEARKANSHGAFVDPQSVEELQQYNAKAFMSDNGGCGVAVKDNGNIVGVFKNTSKYENPIEAAGAASDELLTARLNGGDRLDCYCVTTADKNLVNMYSPAGFEPTHKVRYERGINPEMDAWCENDIKKWVESGHKEEDYVYPDIVFMKVRDGESVEDTLRLLKEDKIPTYDEVLAQMPYTEARDGLSAYEVAEMERNALIDKAPKQGAFFDGENKGSGLVEKGSGKEKISKYRDNSMDKLDSVNDQNAPRSDYGYNEFSVEEQKAAGQKRWGSDPDAVRGLLNKENWDEVDARYAQDRWTQLMEEGDTIEANRLARRMSYELREGGRLVQTAAAMDDIASQLNEARRMINSRVDKIGGVGTSEALDNFATKAEKNLDNIDLTTKEGKDQASKVMAEMMSKDMKTYAPTNKAMTSKQFRKSNKIITDIRSGKLKTKEDIINEVYKQNGSVPIKAEDQKKIYDLLNSAKNLEDGSREQEIALARAAKLATKNIPTTFGEKVRGLLYMNMLGNFKTAISRNAFGNLGYQVLEQARSPFAAGVDWATSRVTGKHSTLGWNKGKFKAYGQGFKKGVKDQASDFVSGLNTGRSGSLGWVESLKNNKGTFNYRGDVKVLNGLSDIANKAEFYVENAMKFGDRPFFEANYQQRKMEIYQLLNRYGKENVAGFSAIPDEALEDTIDMVASVHAADSVFQKQGKISKGLTDLRNGLGKISEGTIGVDLLSTAASPFTLTPGNMLGKAVEYSPIGVIKNAIETTKELRQGKFNQRRFVDEASRTLTGLPVLGAAYGLAKNGVINGGYSDDPDERAAQQEDGFIEYGLNLPNGKTYNTSDIPVIGPFMQAGAAIAEDGVNSKSLLQGASAITAGSTMQGLRRAFGADNGFGSTSSVENLIDTFKSSGTQLVPSLVRQTAQTFDPYKRDLGEYGTNEYYLNAIKNAIPGLRQTLPVKTNVEGEPILQNQGRNIGSKILENYLYPMNVSEYKPSALNQEASRLLDATSTHTAQGFVPKASRTDLRKWDEGIKKEYTEEQFRKYKVDLGQLNSKAGHAVIEADFYKQLDDDTKAKTLSSVYSAMKSIAKENATGIKTDDKIAIAYKNGNVEGMVNYLAGKDAVKESGVSSRSNAGKAIQEAADKGNSEAAYDMSAQVKLLPNYGLDKPGSAATYTKAYGVYGEGYSAEEFAKSYKAIDSDHNQGVKQDEIINYLNKEQITSQDKADQIWSAFGSDSWEYIPSIKDGVWTKKKR